MLLKGGRLLNELVIIVEGETELTFVRDVLAPHLSLHGTSVWPVLPGRHRHHGGVKKWQVTRQDIIRTLKEGRYCSTMFDYYAMPADWPGREDAGRFEWFDRAEIVEKKIFEEITASMGSNFHPKFFVPYVQLHEFEAIAFADVDILASVLFPLGKYSQEVLKKHFLDILDQAVHPEAIDDGYETCPSRRISRLVPAYKKRAQGPIIASRIGLDILRKKCNHFGSWLHRLETIATR
jgi:hypothetical protein